MIKIIRKLGQLVVKLYLMEAKRLEVKAKAEARLARNMAERAASLSSNSVEHIDEAASIVSKAQQLSKIFD